MKEKGASIYITWEEYITLCETIIAARHSIYEDDFAKGRQCRLTALQAMRNITLKFEKAKYRASNKKTES